MQIKPLNASSFKTAPDAQIAFKPVRPDQQVSPGRFQWGPALQQSAQFLAVQHGFRLATGYWARYELRGPFFREWFGAVKGVDLSRWNDGDDVLSNYVGHPLQGAVSGYIQVQNDRSGRYVKFGKSRAYWRSRLKATAWSAAYSAQFEIGPFSEASIGNLGNFTYEENGQLTNGTGMVDFVATPVLGLGWMVTEDALDRFVSDRIERRRKTVWTRILRSALTPGRSMANILRLRVPWYRDQTADGPEVASIATKSQPDQR